MNLDKYWVASQFVHFPSNSVSLSKAALATIAAAFLLLASASSADAEPASATLPEIPPVETVAAPVEAATESVEAVATTVEESPAPTEPSPVTTETAPSSAKVVDEAAEAVDAAVQTTHSFGAAVEEQATAPSPAPHTVVAGSAGRTARIVEEVVKDPVGTGKKMAEPVNKLIEPVGNAITRLTAPLVDLPVLEDPSQLGGLLTQKQGSVSTSPPPSSAIATGDFTSLLTVASPSAPPATNLVDLLTSASGGVASAERSRSSLAGLQAGLDRVRTVAPALGEPRWGPVASPEQPQDRAPLDTPLPAAPSPAVAGSPGSTFFIPFVALLALLALVAPATLRRLREVAAFRAPTPFVCALERPG